MYKYLLKNIATLAAIPRSTPDACEENTNN